MLLTSTVAECSGPQFSPRSTSFGAILAICFNTVGFVILGICFVFLSGMASCHASLARARKFLLYACQPLSKSYDKHSRERAKLESSHSLASARAACLSSGQCPMDMPSFRTCLKARQYARDTSQKWTLASYSILGRPVPRHPGTPWSRVG